MRPPIDPDVLSDCRGVLATTLAENMVALTFRIASAGIDFPLQSVTNAAYFCLRPLTTRPNRDKIRA